MYNTLHLYLLQHSISLAILYGVFFILHHIISYFSLFYAYYRYIRTPLISPTPSPYSCTKFSLNYHVLLLIINTHNMNSIQDSPDLRLPSIIKIAIIHCAMFVNTGNGFFPYQLDNG